MFGHCLLTQMVWSTFTKSPVTVLQSVCLTDNAQINRPLIIKAHSLATISGRNILEGGMLPDQPDNPTRPKILHPQHARPPPHPHHLSGEPSSLFKTCSRSKVQVIQNSVTMHTLLGYQSRVSTIRSQVGVLKQIVNMEQQIFAAAPPSSISFWIVLADYMPLLLGHWYEIMTLYYVKSILTDISASRQDRRVLQKSKIIRIEFLSKWGMLQTSRYV